ncbi:MAG: hypothetical protein ACREYC_18690 [Gammaproteobacteria bacterium]
MNSQAFTNSPRIAPIKLNHLQQRLQQIYQVEVALDVDDFLVTDPTLLRQMEHNGERETKEKLLVLEEGEELNIALYLDAEVMSLLGRDDPIVQLHDGNLPQYLLALEGVSHFLYLTYRAACSRGISLFELELQAEIDKYVTTAALLSRQHGGRVPVQLHQWLFEKPHFDERLRGAQLERYRDANRYAGKYCLALERRYSKDQRGAGLSTELIHFYRLSRGEKIHRIDHG